jgi:arylsulfatase A
MGRTVLIAKDGRKLVELDRKKNDFQLYNLKNDNEERYKLAAQYPEPVSALKTFLLRELNSARPDL